jgi:hypothetical protein
MAKAKNTRNELMAQTIDKERTDLLPVGLTVHEVACRYRVGTQKVLNWIRRGELKATNTSAPVGARPRYVVLPDALLAFEEARASVPEPKPTRRPKRRPDVIDFYPDGNCDLCEAKATQERGGKKLRWQT